MFRKNQTARILSVLFRPLVAAGGMLLIPAMALGQEHSGEFQIALINGSFFRGKPLVSQIAIRVDSQMHSIPIENVKQLTPGLRRRPEFLKHYHQLVRDFTSDDFFTREAASQKMMEVGPEIRGELRAFQNDSDLERRYRVKRILKELDKQSPGVIWSKQDSIETADNTFTGEIELDELKFQTKYGRLQIPLKSVSVLWRGTREHQIDLLKGIDVNRQGVRGRWTMEKGRIITPPNQTWALLQLNNKPSPSYTLHVTAERKTGNDALVFPIVVGQSECNVCLDGWPRGQTHHTGLEMIRGEGPLTNETSHKGVLLPTNQSKDIQIDVTPTSVQLLVNQKQVFHWKGDPSVFSMQNGWNRPDKTVLAIGSYNASFQISRLRLVTQSNLRPALRASVGDCVIDLKEETRFIFRPTDTQTLELRIEGKSQSFPLKNLESLTRIDDLLFQIKQMDNTTLTGKLASESLDLNTKLGSLSTPIREITRIVRVSKP